MCQLQLTLGSLLRSRLGRWCRLAAGRCDRGQGVGSIVFTAANGWEPTRTPPVLHIDLLTARLSVAIYGKVTVHARIQRRRV